MTEEEKKIVSQIKDTAQYKTIIRNGNCHDTIAWIPRLEQTMVLNNYAAKVIYDLIEKQQKEIEELKKYDCRNIKINEDNKIYSFSFTKEELDLMNLGIALYIGLPKIFEENEDDEEKI